MMLPEFRAALVIAGHQDNDALHPVSAQAIEAFIQQTFTKSSSLISGINCQMVNVSTTSIVAA